MSEALYSNENYQVVQVDLVDSEYSEGQVPGYIILNTKTDVVESTTTILPNAMMQADQFDRMIRQMNDMVEGAEEMIAAAEDVTLN